PTGYAVGMRSSERLWRAAAMTAAATVILALPSMAESGAPGSPGHSPAPSQQPLERLTWQVVSERPHDTGAWTEGLLLDASGALYESTGIVGESTVRQVDPLTGAVLRSASVPGDEYGEGLARVDDRLIQLTWKDGVALVWDQAT